jgi:lambda family phage portal protein
MVGEVIDKFIGVFSPAAQAKRMAARIMLRQYAAAKTTRLTGDWSPASTSVNSEISSSIVTIRNRVRQLVRDFPYFARAVSSIVDFSIGQGLTFQSRVKNESGKLDKKTCQAIEDAFSFWADEADISGKLHFYEMMRLAKRQDVEAGEFLIVKRYPKDRKIPFALQIFEPDWLTSVNDTFNGFSPPKDGICIQQGIEYDYFTDRVIAYHFQDPNGYGKRNVIRIPSSDVIHGFETLRPGQLRGISPFAPAVLVAHDLGDYMDAEIDAAKMAAKWLAFVETPDIAGFQSLRAIQDPNSTNKIEEIENALIEYLRPGEKVNLASNNRPGSSFDPFTKLILRMVAVTIGIPYELLSGDYQGLNYTVLRGVRNDFKTSLVPIQMRHKWQFCRPIFSSLMDALVGSGRLFLPGYQQNPFHFLRCQWMPPGMPMVDPLKEGKANANAQDSLLKSPQEIAAERGRDYEEILDEIQMARELQKERGLEIVSVSQANKSNPAELAKEDKNEKK